MKKILSVVMAAAMVMSFMSCNKKGGNSTTPQADSASIAIGNLYGYGIASQFASDSSRQYDKTAFLRGMELILGVDTAETDYQQGMQFGMQVKQMMMGMRMQNNFDMNQEAFIKAFKKAFLSDEKKTPEQLQDMQQTIIPLIEAAGRASKAKDPKAAKNLNDGEQYVKAQLKADKDLVKTSTGLVYKMVAPGAGEPFQKGDVIMVKYVGKHINGDVFDQSESPVAMSAQGVIPGFAEILLMMKPGAKAHVIIPANLAYGEDGNQGIEPNETLVFDIETVGVQAPGAQK